eukprot:COSAG01_NODE_10458_length_2160_cov_103.650170_3_plen_192_part_00
MPRSLTEAFQGSDYTTVAHKHMYLHQSHTYTRTPPGCTRKRRRARGRSIYLLPYQASPHPSSHSIHPPGPTAAPAELQGSQTVQTRPHGSRMSPRPPPAAATTSAAVECLAAPAHAHNNSAPCAWPTWPGAAGVAVTHSHSPTATGSKRGATKKQTAQDRPCLCLVWRISMPRTDPGYQLWICSMPRTNRW